jgi:uncharacterized protein (DUF433 family)
MATIEFGMAHSRPYPLKYSIANQGAFMTTNTVRIVDVGRGPQIEGHRLTVMDVFYYLHRGHDFDFIHRAMPSLTREQFDAVVEYVKDHHDELAEQDRLVDEFHRRKMAELKAKGLHHEIDHSVPVEVRAERLKEKLRERLKEQAEKNGGHVAD